VKDTYQRVYARIWDEPWQEDTRTLALYLLTCRHRRTEGLYKLTLETAAGDLRWPLAKVRRNFRLLLSDGMVKYDENARVVWIVNALDGARPNGHQATHAVKALRLLPATPLLAEFAAASESSAPRIHEALQSDFPEAFANPLTEAA